MTVNQTRYEIASDPMRPLLHVLREELGVTGPKAGCQQGSCGTCTVLVDGEPRRSCLTPVVRVDGAEITTIEGLSDPTRLTTIQAAFHHYYGAQCGFCTPGMITAAHALLTRNPTPTRSEIQTALGGHICRCTGYVKILDAIEAVARGETFDGDAGASNLDPTKRESAMEGASA